MKTDIEIARAAKMKHITEIANDLNLQEIEPYGKYKAKIDPNSIKNPKKNSKLILVTATNPTPMGEGKTTTTVGIGDGLRKIGKNVVIALREPSLGPVFGVKGGAAGGGFSQVVPMEDLNLHFTGDLHAITSANNLLAAMIENHIFQGNDLGIKKVTWKRCLDMNDRSLRKNFDITAASEIMAIFCLSKDIPSLRDRLGNIIVGYNEKEEPITAADLKAQGAMLTLLAEAFKPNLVQTLENTPVLIHGGPFANIAHGCNSIIATKTALALGDYVVTEAGFGADLGAQKFLDIKCTELGRTPDAVAIVSTVRSLKYNGEGELKKGLVNLGRHIENIKGFGLPAVVAINKFGTDTDNEINEIKTYCENKGAECAISNVFAEGGKGGIELAELLVSACEKPKNFTNTYEKSDSYEEKIKKIATKIYRAKDVDFSDEAKEVLSKIKQKDFHMCIAKTQYSFSDDQNILGAPEGFTLNIREIRINAGSGFVVAICGKIMTMPGLPKKPSAENIDIVNGNIVGLF
ncbi:MAG: formate--tetrahydrofolate ligase [Defluviitaleaceae bacterium]|nr:formate--tetrahydrofolate ligase [Defluviitaleaceae bacterium]